MSEGDDFMRGLEAVVREASNLKLAEQAQILARWWKVGGDYEAQAFWMSLCDAVSGPHCATIDASLEPGQVVVIARASKYDPAHILVSSEAAWLSICRGMGVVVV